MEKTKTYKFKGTPIPTPEIMEQAVKGLKHEQGFKYTFNNEPCKIFRVNVPEKGARGEIIFTDPQKQVAGMIIFTKTGLTPVYDGFNMIDIDREQMYHKAYYRQVRKRKYVKKLIEKTCEFCGRKFMGRNNGKNLCVDCSRKARNEREKIKRHSKDLGTGICPVCGTEFPKKCSRQIYCTTKCYIKHRNQQAYTKKQKEVNNGK